MCITAWLCGRVSSGPTPTKVYTKSNVNPKEAKYLLWGIDRFGCGNLGITASAGIRVAPA
jgi:hypothetical protein